MLEEFATELLRLVFDALANIWAPRSEHVGRGARGCREVGRGCQKERKEGANIKVCRVDKRKKMVLLGEKEVIQRTSEFFSYADKDLYNYKFDQIATLNCTTISYIICSGAIKVPSAIAATQVI